MVVPPRVAAQPVNLGPVINTPLRQAEASFTADGKTMYFNCQVRPGPGGNDICVSHLIGTLEEGRWTTPEVVAPGVISLAQTLDSDGSYWTRHFPEEDVMGRFGDRMDGSWRAVADIFNSDAPREPDPTAA